MSKFNERPRNTADATNKCGAPAYSMNDIDMLITQVMSTFFNEHKYYGDNSKEIVDNIRNCVQQDPKFIANLALYVRKEMHMRSIAHVLTSELAHSTGGKKYTREVIKGITERPDDMTEVLAYYINEFGKPIPNSLKKGLADRILGFKEHTLAKYNRRGGVTLKDIVKLTHPKEDNRKLMTKLMNDELKVPDTWETRLSSNKESKQESWEFLIKNKKLGYMALLRNLRNIVQARVSNEAMEMVYAQLKNPNAVKNSKQLPFRFFSAYNELMDVPGVTSKLLTSLEQACFFSCENVETIKGKTLIAIDVSGSMTCRLSQKSEVTCGNVASMLGSMASHICEDSILVAFDTDAAQITFSSAGGIIQNALSVDNPGGGTNLTLPMKHLIKHGIEVDRIIYLSDNVINTGYDKPYCSWYYNTSNDSTTCQTLLNQYRGQVCKQVWFHGIDLLGYGTQQFKGHNVNIISGWSEKVLGFINLVESGTTTFKNTISKYYFK